MRSSTVIAASAALVAGANAYGNATIEYTTKVLTAYTTYCPEATSIVHNDQTYVITEVCITAKHAFRAHANTRDFQATTLTITNCPCTVTAPVVTSPVVYCSTWYPYSAHAALKSAG